MNDVKKSKIERAIEPFLSDRESVEILFKLLYSKRLIPVVIAQLESAYNRPVDIKRQEDRELVEEIVEYYFEHDLEDITHPVKSLISKAISKIGLGNDT